MVAGHAPLQAIQRAGYAYRLALAQRALSTGEEETVEVPLDHTERQGDKNPQTYLVNSA